MNKPLCKNLQNIDMNKTVSFGVCTVSAAEVEEKLKYMHCNWNLQTQINKVQ